MKKLTCFLMLMCSGFLYANELYVKSRYANLQKHPQKRNGIQKVKRGEVLLKIRKVGNWYNVKYKGKKWWVYKGKLSSRAPRRDKSLVYAGYDDVATGSAVRDAPEKWSSKYARFNNITRKHEQFMKYHQSFMTSDREIMQVTDDGIQLEQITTEMLEKFQEDGKIGVYESLEDGSKFDEGKFGTEDEGKFGTEDEGKFETEDESKK